MKLTLDTDDGDDGLLARAYLAAVIGPSRRPNGKPNQVQVGAAPTLLVQNKTGTRVLSVTVSSGAAGQAVNFTVGSGPPFGFTVGNGVNQSAHFLLMPGEELYAAATVAASFSVFSATF